MDNKGTQTDPRTPRWALGLGFILVAVATTVVTTSPFLEKAFGFDDEAEQITRLEGVVDLLSNTVTENKTAVSAEIDSLKKEITSLKTERDMLLGQIEMLQQDLAGEIENRQDLERNVASKEARIKELEELLSDLSKKDQELS